MKYIVLSFDDGAVDFKDNALPILRKYNLFSTINVVSGFVDATVPVDKNIISKYSVNPDTRFLSIDDVVELSSLGFEIANHTNDHRRGSSYESLSVCDNKIKDWCGINRTGIVMPKYSKPSSGVLKYMKEVGAPYITYRDWKINLRSLFIKTAFWKFISLFSHKEFIRYRYLINHCAYKKGNCKKFLRLSINWRTNPDSLFKAFSNIPDGYCLTLCFHSISNDPLRTLYPDGTWSTDKFDAFCKLLSESTDISVIKQIEACE